MAAAVQGPGAAIGVQERLLRAGLPSSSFWVVALLTGDTAIGQRDGKGEAIYHGGTYSIFSLVAQD